MIQSKRLIRLAAIAGLFILVGLIAGWFLFPLPVPGNLQHHSWQLISVETTDGSVIWTPAPGKFTLEFQGYTVRGRTSCNSYGGNAVYIRLLRSLKISSVFSTLMACLPQEGQEPDGEARFLEALTSVRSYALQGNRLYLYFDDSTKVLIFQ